MWSELQRKSAPVLPPEELGKSSHPLSLSFLFTQMGILAASNSCYKIRCNKACHQAQDLGHSRTSINVSSWKVEGKLKREGLHVNLQLIHTAVQQKPKPLQSNYLPIKNTRF